MINKVNWPTGYNFKSILSSIANQRFDIPTAIANQRFDIPTAIAN